MAFGRGARMASCTSRVVFSVFSVGEGGWAVGILASLMESFGGSAAEEPSVRVKLENLVWKIIARA